MKLPIGELRKGLPLGLGFGALMLGQVLLARGAGPELFGRYSLVLSWVNVAVLVAVAGFQFSATKVLPRLAAAGAATAIRFAVGNMVWSVLGLAALAAAGLLALVAANPLGVAPASLQNFWPAVILVPLIALSQIRVAIASALGRLWTGQVPDSILRPVVVGGSVLLLATRATGMDLRRLIILTVAAYALSTAIGGFLLWRALPIRGEAPYDSAGIRAELRRVAAYMGATNIFIGCARNLDVAIVGAMVPPAELAIYVAITRIAEMVNLVYVVADPLYMPRFAASGEASTSHNGLATEVKAYQATATAWSLVCIMVVLVAGRPILQIFGPQYVRGWAALLIASLALSVNAWTGPGGQLLTFLGHEQQNLSSTAASTLVYLAGLVPLTSQFGIEGAAIASLMYQTLRGTTQALLVKRLYGLNITLLRREPASP